MTYASNYTNKATIFDSGDTITGDQVKAIYDELGPDASWRGIAPTITGRYYDGAFVEGSGGGAGNAAYPHDTNVLMAFWYCLPRTGTLDELGTYVTFEGSGTTLRLGLYEADDTASKLPGTLIVAHSGTLDVDTTGLKTAAISQAVERRGVWAVVQTSGQWCETRTRTGSGTLGRATGATMNSGRTLLATRTAAALPSSLAGTSWTVSDRTEHGVYVRYST